MRGLSGGKIKPHPQTQACEPVHWFGDRGALPFKVTRIGGGIAALFGKSRIRPPAEARPRGLRKEGPGINDEGLAQGEPLLKTIVLFAAKELSYFPQISHGAEA